MGYRETSPEAGEKVEKIELLQRESWRRVGRSLGSGPAHFGRAVGVSSGHCHGWTRPATTTSLAKGVSSEQRWR
ncbi:hypothetical protein RRG08_041875 [Elysia crispata]|uniref:Uncharacterized protein n=1 Tax=Elysia crispata TaxID=231223 RepID=A0AAE0Y1I0_9GAST|nr:hypothetical protein RRG08_041875 [Elysia crispata]